MSANRGRRKSRDDDSQNLDSLLDTVANVVGILVVLMAVTQLTINDAMKRIKVWESEEAVAVKAERSEVEAALEAGGEAALENALELGRLTGHLARLRSDPDAARPADSASVAATLASQTLRARRLEAQLSGKRAQLADLRVHLSNFDSKPAPERAELRLPDPRPAPPRAKRVEIVCRYGRCIDPRLGKLKDELIQLLRSIRSSPDDYFRRNDVGNEGFRWRTAEFGRVAVLDWRRTDVGETLSELASPDSNFRKALGRYHPSRHYLVFFVWGDSFDIYLEARRIAEADDFAVGWMAHPDGQEFAFEQGVSPHATPID